MSIVDMLKMPVGSEPKRQVVVLVLDGLGVAPPSSGNAITLANTPTLDKLWNMYPHTYLQAAGTNVGLPHGVDGNSEVGHMSIGAGKIIYQDLPRIDNAINNGSFFQNAKLLKAIETATTNNSYFHLVGLIGSGEVHSSINHLFALLKMAAANGLAADKVLVHAITDGRDSPPQSAANSLEQLESEFVRRKVGRVASIVGRYYAMDRDERWERTEIAYNMFINGVGQKSKSWQDVLQENYARQQYDETLMPAVFPDAAGNVAKISGQDAVIFFNFRPDRAVQITKAFEANDFEGFARQKVSGLYFVGMTKFEQGYPHNIAFPPELIQEPLGKVVAENNLRQLRIAESEKFPHVTYFFNGGTEAIYPGEDRIEVPSPKDVATYDQKPEMSAYILTDLLVNKISTGTYDFIFANYANADMVAHTGNLQASIQATEVLDECLARILEVVLEKDYVLMITADHGNAEELLDLRTGQIDTKHSINPVPLLIIDKHRQQNVELGVGNLADIAPTVAGLLQIPVPPDYTGRNLLMPAKPVAPNA